MRRDTTTPLSIGDATDRAGPLWADYCAALGPAEALACYGWRAPQEGARWGETVYEFRDGPSGALVAWSSLALYPKEPTWVELALGVWPEYQGRGYRRQVLDLTAREAFGTLKADLVCMLVLDTCARHHAICLDEWSSGASPWVLAGRVWHPVKYSIFSYARPTEYSRRDR